MKAGFRQSVAVMLFPFLVTSTSAESSDTTLLLCVVSTSFASSPGLQLTSDQQYPYTDPTLPARLT